MSAYDMHPKFGTLSEYRAWRASWASLHRAHTRRIRALKQERVTLQTSIATAQNGVGAPPALGERLSRVQRDLAIERVMGRKMMTLVQDAKLRAARIFAMKRSMAEQMAGFPLTIDAPSFDFHFNKVSIEYPFMPMWTIKSKGKSYYCHHLDAQGVTMTTKESPDHPSTKGLIRFRKGRLTLHADGTATLEPQPVPAVSEVLKAA